MIVCHCDGVNDRKVRRAIASGARTIEEVAASCGAGRRCGGCWPLLDDLLDEAAARRGDVSRVRATPAA